MEQFAHFCDPLEKVHKQIIRMICKSSYQSHTTPLFHKLNFLKKQHICQFEVAKKMYKIYNANNSAAHKNLQLIKNLLNYNTRDSANENYFLSQKQTK